jgi:hypothetical protein
MHIISYKDKLKGWMHNDKRHKSNSWHVAICLLEELLTRANRDLQIEAIQKQVIEMGRICVELPNELEKKLRFKAIERFGGKKGDLSKAVEESVRTWVAQDK